jgi:hypothetical protein
MELLQRRKFCREFLNGYNEKLHPQIISKVFEIGLLTLKKNYNKLLFTKEELDDIIRDLNENKYEEILPVPSLRQIKDITNSQKENFYISTESNDADMITTKLVRRHKLYNNTLKNPNFSTQNSAIYPNWWWNNKEEEDEDEERPKNNINTIFNEDNDNNDYDNNKNDYNNEINGIFEENNYNLDYFNSNNRNEEIDENNNNEMNCKNYTINKLTMNSNNSKRNNRYKNNDEYIYQEKQNNIPYNNNKNNSFKRNQIKKVNVPNENNNKKESKPRVRSSKITNRNNISNNNNMDHYDKKYKKINNPSQGNKSSKLVKIPKYRYTYKNGRVLRIPEQNNNFGNLTIPNK